MMRNEGSGPSSWQFSYEEVGEILRLIEHSQAAEVRIELNDLRLHVVRDGASEARVTATASSVETEGADAAQTEQPRSVEAEGADAAQTEQPPAEGPPGCLPITAPMVGVFYRALGPDEPPFVEEGTVVEPGDQVAIIEVMKLMNEIQSEVGGVVMRVDATNAELVQYGEPLMWVKPNGDGKAG